MAVGYQSEFNRDDSSNAIRRSNFLFAAGVTAVILGLLFPRSAYILDVLLIFSVSLTAAIVIITYSAQSAMQVLSFPLLAVLATMLRITLSVASTKSVLSGSSTSVVIRTVGNILVANSYVPCVLIFIAAAIISFAAICRIVKNINRTASDFTSDIACDKQCCIDNELNAGIINNQQALELKEKSVLESNFFAKMNRAAKFTLCDAVIVIAVIIINTVGSIFLGSSAVTTSAATINTHFASAVGAGMITILSTLITASGCGWLVRKSFATAANDVRPQDQDATTERIKVVAKMYDEATSSQDQDSKDNDAVNCDESEKPFLSRGKLADEKAVTEELEWYDESQYIENNNAKENLWACEEITEGDSYEAAAELVESEFHNDVKTVLMASENIQALPVTVPVNIAIQLVQKGKSCVLVDLDTERNALSKVFEIDNSKSQAKAVATCINNLWVRPVGNSIAEAAVNLKQIITNLESEYDHLIVYAPNIGVQALSDREKLAGAVQNAMVFGLENNVSAVIRDFQELLTNYGCEALSPGDILAQVC